MRDYVKKLLCVIIVVAVIFSGCGYSKADLENARRAGYNEGYSDGYHDAEIEHEDDYYEGYREGFDDADCERVDLLWAIEDASFSARDKTGWSVYEAYNNVAGYLNLYDNNGSPPPTYDEFVEGAITLFYFAEFLDREKLLY